MATAIITLSAPVASDQDTHRDLTVQVNGVALPMVDLGPTGITFTTQCNPGDAIVASDTDINVVGSSTPGVATATCPQAPPTSVPSTPSVGITFGP